MVNTNELHKLLEDKLFLSSFLTSIEINNFNLIIQNYVKNRISLELLSSYIDDLSSFFELIGLGHKDMIVAIANWPAILHSNKDDLLVKYALLAKIKDSKTGACLRDDIIVNHPKDLMIGKDLIYARIMFFLSDCAEDYVRKEEITRRKALKVTNVEFLQSYRLSKDELLKKFQYTAEDFQTILNWPENELLKQKIEEKKKADELK